MRLERSALVNLGVVVLAAATALLLLLTRGQPTQTELDARARNLVPEFRASRLVKLVVSHDDTRLELHAPRAGDAGSPGEYRLGPPPGRDADPEAVRSFLSALELAAFLKRLDAEGADRELLGLEPPRAELELELDDRRGVIAIGKPALTPKDTTYVEVRGFEGEPRLGLVRTASLSELLVSEHSLRPQWIVPLAPSELAFLNLAAGPNKTLELERRGPAFRSKGGERVARSKTERFLLELSRARADRPLAGEGAAFAPETTLRAEFVPIEQRPKAVIELGNECPGAPDRFALKRVVPDPGSFCVDSALKVALLDLLATPHDDAVFSLRTDEIESLSVEGSGKKFELRRAERGFELGDGPSRVAIELAAGNRLLDELLSARGERLDAPDRRALGLEPPRGSITLRSSAIERMPTFEESVVLGSPSADGGVAVMRRFDGVVLLLGRDAARALSPDESALRPRRVLDFGPSDLRSLLIVRGGQRQRLRRTESGVFELLEPRGFTHDPGLVLELIQALGTLEVDRWVDPREGEQGFGFEAPRVRVELELLREARPEQVSLEIGGETSGGYFGRLEGKGGVFVVPRALVHDLTTLLLARDVFVVAPSQLAGLALRVGKRSIELERHDGGFRAKPGTPELAVPLVERVVALASSLRAEAAVHTGPARSEEGLAAPATELSLHVTTPVAETIVIRIGAESRLRGSSVRFARRSGIDATYALSSESVRELEEAL